LMPSTVWVPPFRSTFRSRTSTQAGSQDDVSLLQTPSNKIAYKSKRALHKHSLDAIQYKLVLGPQRYTPPPGLGPEKIGKWLVWTIWWCISYIQTAVKYNTFYIHHPGGPNPVVVYIFRVPIKELCTNKVWMQYNTNSCTACHSTNLRCTAAAPACYMR